MKRFLLSLVALVVTSVCFAQDIIVQKDGSSIQAKVVKVSQSEVEHKKYNNQNGLTYAINTKDFQCINYENGAKDAFVSQNYNPSTVTNETTTQFSNDEELLQIFNKKRKFTNPKARRLEKISWIGAPIVIVCGAILANQVVFGAWIGDDCAAESITIGLAAGVAWWAGFHLSAKSIENRSLYSLQTSPIYQHDFKFGKSDHLMVGIDMLKDNTRKNHTLGLGVSYNF